MCHYCYYIILLCVLNIGVISLGKETEENGSSTIFSEFIQRLKRLDNDYDHRQSAGEYSQNSPERNSVCSPKKPQTDTIIRSHASIENGAKYIRAHNDIKSSRECLSLCCQDHVCDTSIFEEKGDRRCYLFACGNLCLFKDYGNYTVWTVERHIAGPPPPVEEELANLHDSNKAGGDSGHADQGSLPESHRGNGERNGSPVVGKDQTRLTTPTPSPQTPRPERIAPHTAGLSDHCTSDVSCEDPNAGCHTGICQCGVGFYNKKGLCRKQCESSDFGCLGLGTTGRGPECIPKSQICDSYMQCADGSDEFNCDRQDLQSNPNPSMPGYLLNKDKGLSQSSNKVGAKESKTTVDDNDQSASTDTKEPKSKGPTPQTSENTSHKDSASKSVKTKSKPSAPTKASKLNLTHTTTKKPHPSVGHNKVFVSREKVIIASSTSEAEGPIIALALGLAFTLILIVLLGCRLRNMKHRLKKGRPLNSNEADYLINGMYL